MKTKQCDVLGSMFEIYDIGFSRSSRSEWMNFFASAKAVVFVVDLTNFDQTVTGDKKGKNKMVRFYTVATRLTPKGHS
jgi:ADP-ribosylation factor family